MIMTGFVLTVVAIFFTTAGFVLGFLQAVIHQKEDDNEENFTNH
ncbi:hypothetical protein ACQ1Q1_09615 [Ornithobacterium rhinotracheale]|uniref:Uncharacterized protein n=1 Tax=Ornithobacterium rhinotracheale (strain ATCC 51463 / DSM 15997 / CCUG 23171 / CIP 104009 / LMG 9086) TaxID=867902 RepID=I4A360_ORNRL|nr:hypothetical protein [Ornithobacterium rhinotracheale]AFL98394.1 hypothetical protein Ornrh_2263 [Ornithobacterium rhinotracheale DSM 15997]AIQ00751.1 hypothetical protein Q785_11465 [Ornithobacterium rhinotracheale ORT-UMN 88]KGB65844.1 hypothetical protein Q787_10995 [Ornithobacterium rhinotracheale H06-030791]